MKRALCLVAVLVLAAVAWATVSPPLPADSYMFVYGSPPQTAYFSAFAGPPPTLELLGVTYTYNPEDGLYHAPSPNSDTFEHTGGGTGTWVDWPPFPQAGPPTTNTGNLFGGM